MQHLKKEAAAALYRVGQWSYDVFRAEVTLSQTGLTKLHSCHGATIKEKEEGNETYPIPSGISFLRPRLTYRATDEAAKVSKEAFQAAAPSVSTEVFVHLVCQDCQTDEITNVVLGCAK